MCSSIAQGCQSAFGTCGWPADDDPPTYNTSGVSREKVGSIPYAPLSIYSCTVPGTVALTFDDGPYIYTLAMLDVLDSLGAKATFFITGNNLGKGAISDPANGWDTVIEETYRRGHQLASHTWTHPDLSTLTADGIKSEFYRLESAFVGMIGKFPTYMRPPYSSCDNSSACPSTLSDLGYHITYFDLDTDDYDNTTPELIQNSKNIVTAAINGSNPTTDSFLSIAHDIHEQTATNLTQFELQTLYAAGYKAVTLGECLGDPEENWYRVFDNTTYSVTALSTTAPSTTTTSTIASSATVSSSTASSTTTSTSSTTISSTTISSATASSTTTSSTTTYSTATRSTSASSTSVATSSGTTNGVHTTTTATTAATTSTRSTAAASTSTSPAALPGTVSTIVDIGLGLLSNVGLKLPRNNPHKRQLLTASYNTSSSIFDSPYESVPTSAITYASSYKNTTLDINTYSYSIAISNSTKTIASSNSTTKTSSIFPTSSSSHAINATSVRTTSTVFNSTPTMGFSVTLNFVTPTTAAASHSATASSEAGRVKAGSFAVAGIVGWILL
ncbi:hypothetical protein RUND412_008116 [Rhizina undulata]